MSYPAVCYSCSAASPLPSYDYYSRQPNARLDETQARFIIAECVLSLEYIHRCIAPRDCAVSFWFHLFARSKGYVHRDIKPENVLLTADGHCKMVGPFSFVLACVCLCAHASSAGRFRPVHIRRGSQHDQSADGTAAGVGGMVFAAWTETLTRGPGGRLHHACGHAELHGARDYSAQRSRRGV